MDPGQVIGNPLIVAAVASVTVFYAAAVFWMTYSIYRVTPELLQVQVFRKLKELQASVLYMGLGLIVGMVLVTLLLADVALPDVAWWAGGITAGILFWYGLFSYSKVFHVPRGSAGKL